MHVQFYMYFVLERNNMVQQPRESWKQDNEEWRVEGNFPQGS